MGVYPHRGRPMRTVRSNPVSVLLLGLSALAVAPGPANAAEPTPSEISVARRLFEEGKAAEDAGRWREAAAKFRQATAIKDTPGIRFHLARCEEEQGALVEALVEYDRARELLERGAKAPDVERLLPAASEKVRAKVAMLTLRLPEEVSGVSVELDGKAISPTVLGVALPVNPGAHRLEAVAPGRKPFALDLSLATGEVKQVAIELARDEAAAGAPPPATRAPAPAARRADDSPFAGRTVVLVAEGSLFVAGLATGIVFSIKRSAADDRYERANRIVVSQQPDPSKLDSACSMPLEGCADVIQARDERAQAGTIAAIGFVAAGVSAAAFGLTYWLWPTETPPADLTVSAGPGRFGFALAGSF
jgi:hypothetical protein